MVSANASLVPNRLSLLGGPFHSRRQTKLLWDLFPGRQQQDIVAGQPLRGSIKFVAASNQYLTRAGNLTNCNLFNFQNDGVTTKFSIAWYSKFATIASGQTLFQKSSPAAFNAANSVWGVATGGVGTRYDLYANDGSTMRSVTWTIGAGLTADLLDFNVLTYDGGGSASKAKFYRNGTLLSTPDSTAMPQLFANNNNANCEFSIARAIAGALNFGGEMAQPLFFNGYVLTQTDVDNLHLSGAGQESSNLTSVLGIATSNLCGLYNFDESSGASRLDSSPFSVNNTLTDNGTCETRPRIVTFIENSANHLALVGGGFPPSNAPTKTRRREPWLKYNSFGPGLHSIVMEKGTSLYVPTSLFSGITTGNYFFAGRYLTALDTENYECQIGDDTQGVSPPGNDHSMFFGTWGPTNSGLSAGLSAACLRPDATGMDPSFGGNITNLAGVGAGGPAAGGTYPGLTEAHVRELSLIDLTDGSGAVRGGYRISINGIDQPIYVNDGGQDVHHRWLADFNPNSLFFGTDEANPGNSYEIGRACMFGSSLADRERIEVARIMKVSIGIYN